LKSLYTNHRPIWLMLGAALSFSLMAAVAKYLSRDFDTAQQVFFRNITGVVFISISLLKRPAVHIAGKPVLLVFRGIIGTLSLYLLFYAIGSLGMGRAITYQYTYPIFMAVFSWILFREKLTYRESGAIILGFAGILCIFRPDLSMPPRSHLIGLGNALLTTFAYLSIKQLGRFYDSRYIVMSFMLGGIVLPVISMILGRYFSWGHFDFLLGHFRWPVKPEQWAGFLALGITALLGQVAMTKAFTVGKAGPVAAVSYTNILFSSLLGIWMGEALPDLPTTLGMLLIIGAGILVSAKRVA